jgi:hypothetical protein
MLEQHLAEINHQGESKIQYPEPLAIESFSMPHYTEKTGGLLPGRHLADQTGKHQMSHGIPPVMAGINQNSPLGRLTLRPLKKKN